MWSQGNPCALLVEMQIGTATMESSMAVPLKIKNRTTIWPTISFLSIYLRKTETLTWKDICIPIFTAALFTMAKIWKQPQCYQQMNEWRRCSIYIYTQVEYYSAIKKEVNLPLVITWMDLEGIMLREISQKNKYIVWSQLYVES